MAHVPHLEVGLGNTGREVVKHQRAECHPQSELLREVTQQGVLSECETCLSLASD